MKFPESLIRSKRIAAKHAAAVGARPLFTADAAGNRGELFIYEDIGGFDWWTGQEGLTAKRVADALAAMKGATTLDIFINSGGGDIWEAKAIYEQLLRFGGERIVHIDGIAASAASFIAMVGTKIITGSTATWMIHEVQTIAMGRAADLRATADVLDLENKTFAETYAARTKRPVDEILGWMAAETWMNAAEAKDRGFTDEISAASAPVPAPAPQTGSLDELELAAALMNATSTLRARAA